MKWSFVFIIVLPVHNLPPIPEMLLFDGTLRKDFLNFHHSHNLHGLWSFSNVLGYERSPRI